MLNQQNVEAAMKAGSLWAKAYEELGKAYFSSPKMPLNMVWKGPRLLLHKNLQDFIDVQTVHTKKLVNYFAADGAKMLV